MTYIMADVEADGPILGDYRLHLGQSLFVPHNDQYRVGEAAIVD